VLFRSTPIIEWFETEFPESPIIPQDPEQAFFCQLLEDYSDEWLWRPAMHYRWHYQQDAFLLGRKIAGELLFDIPLPQVVMAFLFRRRQRVGFTVGDGIHKGNIEGVEAIFLNVLQQLQAIFEKRPYLLGDKPSLADIAFSGPFFKHFGVDPTASLIIRETAPAVYEWIARLWNAKHSQFKDKDWLTGIPEDWGPLLDDMGIAYVPYLCANAEAFNERKKRFNATIDGVEYRKARTSRYRVGCLERLQKLFNELPEDIKPGVKARLQKHKIWQPLWQHKEFNHQLDKGPFGCGTNMFGMR
jgi:glutathione S-transferase